MGASRHYLGSSGVPQGPGDPSGRGHGSAGSGTLGGTDEDFTAFASIRVAPLGRTAYLLCGDWAQAQDLTQITLTRMYAAWRRIHGLDNLDAYARKTMLHAYLGERRRKRSTERPIASVPETVATDGDADVRLAVLAALAQLPPRSRAVLVLRYWEDHSVETVASMLGCSQGTVKSQTARALEKLRVVLGDALDDLRT